MCVSLLSLTFSWRTNIYNFFLNKMLCFYLFMQNENTEKSIKLLFICLALVLLLGNFKKMNKYFFSIKLFVQISTVLFLKVTNLF